MPPRFESYSGMGKRQIRCTPHRCTPHRCTPHRCTPQQHSKSYRTTPVLGVREGQLSLFPEIERHSLSTNSIWQCCNINQDPTPHGIAPKIRLQKSTSAPADTIEHLSSHFQLINQNDCPIHFYKPQYFLYQKTLHQYSSFY
jgi:hypothetical protein